MTPRQPGTSRRRTAVLGAGLAVVLAACVAGAAIATALAFDEDPGAAGDPAPAAAAAASPAAATAPPVSSPAPPPADAAAPTGASAAPFPGAAAPSATAATPRPAATVWAPSRALLPAKGPLVDPEVRVGEWLHAWQVIGLLRAQPPRAPVVLLFGDSTAREAVVSDEAWTRELRGRGVPATAYTLASHGQSFRIDRRFVEELPRLRGLALIGVGLSRFVLPLDKGPMGRPATFATGEPRELAPWPRHYFDERGGKTAAAKLERVTQWRKTRSTLFRRLLPAGLRELGRLVEACRRRGLEPVLVQLPLNATVVAGSLDAEREAVSRGCRKVARRLGVRFVDEPVAPDLTDADFHDTVHLLHSGAVKWQRGVADLAAELLQKE